MKKVTCGQPISAPVLPVCRKKKFGKGVQNESKGRFLVLVLSDAHHKVASQRVNRKPCCCVEEETAAVGAQQRHANAPSPRHMYNIYITPWMRAVLRAGSRDMDLH